MKHSHLLKVCFLGLFLISGCLNPKSADQKKADVSQPLQQCVQQYYLQLQQNFQETAQKLKQGEFQTAEETHHYLTQRNEQARINAFRSLDEHLQHHIGSDRWNQEAAIKIFLQLAEESKRP